MNESIQHSAETRIRALWVPAFAGTTNGRFRRDMPAYLRN
jgi:hypothetical protein